ncbi:HK97 gp10 family phage protein [Weissella viridescens]|uniref:HK97 gp10 family phage protein n=1 Tax=Weissella viridescens TaxID=1629 RepID=UPI003AF31346
MSEFSSDLEDFNSQILSLTNLSISDKEAISKEGAIVFKKELKDVVRNRHYRIRSTGENPHLADTLGMRPGNRDSRRTGAYTVGWGSSKQKNGKDFIANFIENGTRVPFVKTSNRGLKFRLNKGGSVGVRRDPFISETQQNAAVNQTMLEVMSKRYNEITTEKN